MNEKRKGKNEKRTKEAIELKNENSPCCKWCDHQVIQTLKRTGI